MFSQRTLLHNTHVHAYTHTASELLVSNHVSFVPKFLFPWCIYVQMKNQKIVILGEEKDGNVTADSEWENRGNPLATKWRNTPLRLSDSFTERLWSQVCLERWLRGEACGPWRQEEGEDVVWRALGWLSSVISNSGGWGKSYHRFRASLSRNRKEIVPEAC